MTWDAASHALIGLDIYDHLRRFEPVRLLLRMQGEHWWPPLFGILSLPAWAFGGRALTSPSLVSLVSYGLIPLFAWLAIRRATSAAPLLAFALVALFCLRSPQFLEMSAWSMLEPSATLFAAVAFFCFLAGPGTRARNWAYGLAGASTLLKYHYGFFLLITFGVATVFEAWSAGDLVRARRLAGRRPIVLPLPSVATTVWIAYILTLLYFAFHRDRARELWRTLPVPIRRFLACGVIWPAVLVIDLANAQAWYRQLRVRSDPPAQWIDQIREIARYLTDDYFLGPVALGVAGTGLALCFVEGFRRRNVPVLAVAFHAIWPLALMTLSSFRIESRFLSTIMIAFAISAALGWLLFLEHRSRLLPLAIVAIVIGDQVMRQPQWQDLIASRRVYGYLSSEPPDRFVRATIAAMNRGEPVLIILPRDIQVVAPTIRLGLRLAMPDVGPADVIVRGGGLRQFEERLRRFDGGLVAVETDAETLRRLVAARNLHILSIERGPAVPGTDRVLLIAVARKGEDLSAERSHIERFVRCDAKTPRHSGDGRAPTLLTVGEMERAKLSGLISSDDEIARDEGAVGRPLVRCGLFPQDGAVTGGVGDESCGIAFHENQQGIPRGDQRPVRKAVQFRNSFRVARADVEMV